VSHLQVCNTVPVPQNRPAKETECQRCRKYAVPTPTTKWAIECNPVYDEKCKTRYVHVLNSKVHKVIKEQLSRTTLTKMLYIF
jgi:hypothetical protein